MCAVPLALALSLKKIDNTLVQVQSTCYRVERCIIVVSLYVVLIKSNTCLVLISNIYRA